MPAPQGQQDGGSRMMSSHGSAGVFLLAQRTFFSSGCGNCLRPRLAEARYLNDDLKKFHGGQKEQQSQRNLN